MIIDGRVFRRGEPGYEDARQAAVWNARKPDRFPDLIVQAAHEADVVEAVRHARNLGLKIKARSGGHSWTASSVRGDGILVDLSRLQEITIDPPSHTATVSPAAKGRDLNERLAPHGLFFPGGHCPTVGLGGFLLQGGWGWNSRLLGPACVSVRGVDVVTAEGELIHANADENSDFYWAARGAGPGFFGIVTRFHLTLHARPTVIRASSYVYRLDLLDEILRWAIELQSKLPPALEFVILGTTPRGPDRQPIGENSLIVSGAALMDSEGEAKAALGLLETCPVIDKATERVAPVPLTFAELYEGPDALEPEGVRWAADGMWTDAASDELVPAVRDLFGSVPTPLSHIFWYPWHEQPLPDMALSITGKLYVAAFSGWHDENEDEAIAAWPTEQMRKLEPFSKGIQLADENLVNRPWPYLSPENTARLEALRRRHDPDGVFHSHLLSEEVVSPASP